MRELFLLGRILVGGYYVMSGIRHFTGLNATAAYAAAKGVPAPTIAVAVSGLLLLIAGVSLLLGVVPKIGVAALVLFFVPVTFMMHQFWNAHGMARVAEMTNFTKNIALLGSGLMFLAVPEPWPLSIGNRVRLRLSRRRFAHV